MCIGEVTAIQVNFHPNGFLLSTDVYGCQSLPDFVELSDENCLLIDDHESQRYLRRIVPCTAPRYLQCKAASRPTTDNECQCGSLKHLAPVLVDVSNFPHSRAAGPSCTCTFKKCVGTVCYTVGSSRQCLPETWVN